MFHPFIGFSGALDVSILGCVKRPKGAFEKVPSAVDRVEAVPRTRGRSNLCRHRPFFRTINMHQQSFGNVAQTS
jgi:hypothetical protein